MVQSISLDTKDLKIDSKNSKSTTTNTDFLDLLLKDIKEKDLDKDSLKDDKENPKDEKQDTLKDLLNFNSKTNDTDTTHIKLTDLLDNTKADTKLSNNDLKEIKNIISSQLKQNNILLSKQDEKDFKSMDNLKDLINFADKKGLNIEKLKFDIAKDKKLDITKNKFIDTKNISSTKMKLDNLQKEPSKSINIEKNPDSKAKTVSLENILNKKPEIESKIKTKIEPKKTQTPSVKQITTKDTPIQTENIEKTTNILKTTNIKETTTTIQKNTEIKVVEKEIKPSNKEPKITTEKKSIDLASLLNPDKDDKTTKIEPKKQSTNENNLNLPNQTMVNEVKAKSVQAKETIKYFNQNLDEAIKNYKPPVSKVNIELNPQNLGKVDVTIIQRGKNIQVHMNTDQSNVQLFQNNQAEFRQALSNIGFSNIDMSFNSNQDRDRRQNQAKKTYKENESLETIDNIESGDIEIKANYHYA